MIAPGELAMPRRVLCVEADDGIRARLKAALEAAGFTVDTAGSGLEGIERALARPPDLVLADAHLPDLEGADLAARLKREKAFERVPVVAVGATREEHDDAIAAGADGFLDRGFDQGIADDVRAFLDGRRERLPEEGERERLRALSGSMAARLESAVAGERRAAARVADLDRLKIAFMNNLAHEISTPLTPLAGYLEILRGGKLGEPSPRQRRVLDAMAQALARLTRIADNLSDFASLQAAETTIHEGEVDPDDLADAVVEEQRAAIREARLHVTVIHAGVGPVVADPRKLRQAVANVFSNAVKFSPHGGEVLLEVTAAGGRLRFAVYDQGPGIRPEEAQTIFEPLLHAAARGADDARLPGSGLGLPVARRIGEAHGGRVWVESPPRTQPGSGGRHFAGSKFVLEIPIHPVARREASGSRTDPSQRG